LASNELHAVAVRLVARLPDGHADLSPDQLDALADLFDEIAGRLEESTALIDSMLGLASQRGYQDGSQPLDYLTPAERATFDVGDRRGLDAGLAHETLTRWKEASGWRR
jgi:hypothetical protein